MLRKRKRLYQRGLKTKRRLVRKVEKIALRRRRVKRGCARKLVNRCLGKRLKRKKKCVFKKRRHVCRRRQPEEVVTPTPEQSPCQLPPGILSTEAFNKGHDEAYNEGFNEGFAKGYEEGHQMAYAKQ